MNENPTATDWTTTRGEKWRAQLAGMEGMLAAADEPLIRALDLDTACRIADIGCGGGGTTLQILRLAPVGSVVHGFDISPASGESARSRKPSDERAVAFEVADMATATAPEEPYDRLISRFGIMFFDDPSAAFVNLVRWLALGGRFAFAVWRRMAENPWMTTVRKVVAEISDLAPPDPDAPGPFRYADANKLFILLDRARFGDINVHQWRGALPIGGGLPPAEATNFALASFSSFGEPLAETGDEALSKARQSLASRFFRQQQDGAVRMDASPHIFTGARLGSSC